MVTFNKPTASTRRSGWLHAGSLCLLAVALTACGGGDSNPALTGTSSAGTAAASTIERNNDSDNERFQMADKESASEVNPENKKVKLATLRRIEQNCSVRHVRQAGKKGDDRASTKANETPRDVCPI